MLPPLRVDLSMEPEDRWRLNPEHRSVLRELVEVYNADMGITAEVADLVELAATQVLPEEFQREIHGLARRAGVPYRDVLSANFYYDAIKFACTAVAVDSPRGPMHARNLDWWTPRDLLSTATVVVDYVNACGGPFRVVGWPGHTGVFSGVAEGRFAVSLNAVLSGEPGQQALPVVYLLRRTLEQAETFQDAVQRLSKAAIPCDCLLLVTGPNPGELIVVERTPTQHAFREAVDGAVWVTNDYRVIDVDSGVPTGELQETSCGRYDRMGDLLAERRPETAEDFFRYLSDPGVRMDITVQQMFFHAQTGEVKIADETG